MKKEITMKVIRFLSWLLLSVLLSACAVVTTAGDIAQGRQAMLEGNYQLALDYFWTGDQVDPNYTYGAELREGVLSFLGRAPIPHRELCTSASDLGKNLSYHRSDNVARLYLGLTLVRLGDRQAGLTNIQRGMSGIYNWLEYLNMTLPRSLGKTGTRAGQSGPALKVIST
jgi:hypothetical protein